MLRMWKTVELQRVGQAAWENVVLRKEIKYGVVPWIAADVPRCYDVDNSWEKLSLVVFQVQSGEW